MFSDDNMTVSYDTLCIDTQNCVFSIDNMTISYDTLCRDTLLCVQ